MNAGPDPDQDAHIRALLAELGSGSGQEPMPEDVATRLEDTLAGLVAERDGTEEAAGTPLTVVPLRRRWTPRLVAAAAAVIVLGVGGVTAANLDLFETSRDSGASAGSTADRDAVTESAPESGADAAASPRLGSATFATDVAALLEREPALAQPKEGAREWPNAGRLSRSCPGPKATGGAVHTLIRYDGADAVLLVHPVRDGRRLVEAWTCDGARTLATTTLTR